MEFLRVKSEDMAIKEWYLGICAYNLMFDMQTLMLDLNMQYDMKATAQSSTNVYTLDLIQDGETVLRFWDTYHLEMRGLAAMGETAGLEKATKVQEIADKPRC